MAHTKGQFVGGKTEEKDADELRLAVADALCRGPERLNTFKEVMHTIDAIEGGLQRCPSSESLSSLHHPYCTKRLTVIPLRHCTVSPVRGHVGLANRQTMSTSPL